MPAGKPRQRGKKQRKSDKSYDPKPLVAAIEREEGRLEKKEAANQENQQWRYPLPKFGLATG